MLIAGPSCRRLGQGYRDEPSLLKVVATTGMIADLVRWIGEGFIQLSQLIGEGVDPHLYKPIRDDVVDVLEADIVFTNGLLLEGRMSELLSQASNGSRRVVAMADAIESERYLGEPGTDAKDPHLWMDVSMWSTASTAIERGLIEWRPEHGAKIRQRGAALRERLDALDDAGRRAMASIPAPQRLLITSHDAFQYFGRRYGIEVQGIQGLSTASETGLQRIPELIDMIVSRSVRAVFHESSVAGRMVDAMVEGAQARGYALRVGEELYSDALGPRGSDADNYIGMMEHNFRAIATALGGEWTP